MDLPEAAIPALNECLFFSDTCLHNILHSLFLQGEEMNSLFTWQLHGNGKTLKPGEVVEPDERLTWTRTAGIGAQHVIAMFGATFLVPILTGFDPSTTLMFTAISTALFLLINANKLPR